MTLLVLPLVELVPELDARRVSGLVADNSGAFLAFGVSFLVTYRFWARTIDCSRRVRRATFAGSRLGKHYGYLRLHFSPSRPRSWAGRTRPDRSALRGNDDDHRPLRRAHCNVDHPPPRVRGRPAIESAGQATPPGRPVDYGSAHGMFRRVLVGPRHRSLRSALARAAARGDGQRAAPANPGRVATALR